MIRLWCSISDKFFITMCNSLSSYDCSLQVLSALIFVDYILWRKTTTTLMWKTETHFQTLNRISYVADLLPWFMNLTLQRICHLEEGKTNKPQNRLKEALFLLGNVGKIKMKNPRRVAYWEDLSNHRHYTVSGRKKMTWFLWAVYSNILYATEKYFNTNW